MSSVRQCALALAFMLSTVAAAGASPITFTFSGTVDLTGAAPDGTFGTLADGLAFSGLLTYESTTPPFITSANNAGYNAVTAFALTVGSETVTTAPGGAVGMLLLGSAGSELQVAPALSFDSNGTPSFLPIVGSIGGLALLPEYLFLKFSAPGGVFSSSALPTAVDSSAFSDGMVINMQAIDPATADFVALALEIDSLKVTTGTATPVPEPATLSLLGIGIAIGATRRFRVRR